MELLQALALLLVAATGTGVALTREPVAQTIGLSFFGLTLTLLFVACQAPDVALSQITVGAVALPLLFMFTLARLKRHDDADRAKARARELSR
jgi:uncharacterized MnhB-related membrane protein